LAHDPRRAGQRVQPADRGGLQARVPERGLRPRRGRVVRGAGPLADRARTPLRHPATHRAEGGDMAELTRVRSAPAAARPRRRGATAGLVARYAVLIFTVVLSIFPLVWLVLTSLRTSDELFAVPVQLFPSTVTFDQYVTVFTEYEMADYVTNSVVVSLATVALVTVLALPCAYVLARFRLPGIKVVITVLLIMRMIPVIALAIPLFAVFSGIGLLDTVLGLVLTHAASKLPVAI